MPLSDDTIARLMTKVNTPLIDPKSKTIRLNTYAQISKDRSKVESATIF